MTTHEEFRKLIQVDRETAERFYDAGGTIHYVPWPNDKAGTDCTLNREWCDSLDRGMKGANDFEPRARALTIDLYDTHPANPLRVE